MTISEKWKLASFRDVIRVPPDRYKCKVLSNIRITKYVKVI